MLKTKNIYIKHTVIKTYFKLALTFIFYVWFRYLYI